MKTEVMPVEKQDSPNRGLLELAIEKNHPIEVIEKLMVLEEKWRASKSLEMYAKAFVEMKPNLPLVIKTKDNKQTSSKYAALENINQVVDPILAKYGFATSTKILSQKADSVTIGGELWHNGGHIETTSITLPLDDKGMQGTVNKTKIHATSSTVTYGRRIVVCVLLNISTGDDTDGQKPPTKPITLITLQPQIDKCKTRKELSTLFATLDGRLSLNSNIKKAFKNKQNQLPAQ